MKKTLISIMILFALVFSLSAKDDPLLDFINGLFTGKIPYTTESFVKQGFVYDKEARNSIQNNNVPEMTLDEINAEIAATRK